MTRAAERRKSLMASMMKEEIYEAAVAVLTQHGLDGMTMDRIAAEAGVGKASLYKYFGNKQEMLAFIHAKAIEPVMQAVAAYVATDLPADRKLEAILRTWFEYLGEHQGLFNLFFNDSWVEGVLKSQKDASQQSGMQHIRTILREGIEAGIFRVVDPSRTTSLIFGAIRQLVEQQLAKGGPWPADEFATEVMDFILRGLGAEPDGNRET